MDPNIKYDLPADTAKLFTLAPGAPPIFERVGFGKTDVRSLTPSKAQQLVDDGCKHIVPVAAAPDASADALAKIGSPDNGKGK